MAAGWRMRGAAGLRNGGEGKQWRREGMGVRYKERGAAIVSAKIT